MMAPRLREEALGCTWQVSSITLNEDFPLKASGICFVIVLQSTQKQGDSPAQHRRPSGGGGGGWGVGGRVGEGRWGRLGGSRR